MANSKFPTFKHYLPPSSSATFNAGAPAKYEGNHYFPPFHSIPPMPLLGANSDISSESLFVTHLSSNNLADWQMSLFRWL